ncbi:P-loop containing nucleoside triphosphate hydrolase protein [Lophiotrema nucula]|uniref:P-loop containing nucleoside triphosphate hydrolase protein n=1 Tax=Lophiotrema nucula TaxID=690887 RepID=A0A6A5ZN93_9PLEO|nr:P-loop containing nucleoside triphosphate hydrolase protein [Lophiotrema nucula]
MSRSQKNKHHERAVRAFTEDDGSSGSESGLDIIGSTRKELDLSQYIDVLTQTQTQDDDEVQDTEDEAEDEKEATEDEGSSGMGSQLSDIDLPEFDNPEAAYEDFNNRKKRKRKAVQAEASRIRAAKKSKAAAATSIIGRKPLPKKKIGNLTRANPLSTASEGDPDANDAYLDDPIPEYIEARKRKLKKLHEAGLRYPPDYDDVDLSDSESEEKPILHRDIKPQRVKKDIILRESGGIIPAPIAQWLRDYQVDGVKFLHKNFVRQTGALLGDDMGLGKTIQVIAFLTAAFGKSATRCDAKRMRKVRRMSDRRWYPKILVVCPGTLMRNWEDELEKWGWWQVYKYHGPPAERDGVLQGARRGMTEIMITTYDTYRNNESQINTIDWDCVIADECHIIKNKAAAITKAMNKVNALCRIGLTGTAIQNKYEELWNLLNWARPGVYGSAQSWKQLISIPLKMGQAHDATNAQLASARMRAKELAESVLPDVFLRRMKTLIADQLPKKTDRVVFCALTETQADAYQTLLETDKFEYVRRAYEECDCQSGKARGWCCYQEVPGGGKWVYYTFPCMINLTKLANHLALLIPSSNDLQDKQTKDLETLQEACPEKWKDLYRNRESVLNLSSREYCGKWKVLKRLLDFWNANGDKVLVFSHSVRLLRLLKGLFDRDGTNYNFSYLDGSMSYEERARQVADFNSNPSQFVFLISTKAGGVGLNITSANKVVVFDPNWNPAYDLQAQDRAYRIGQTRDVEVFRLVSSGTIEEVIYARQIYKQQQANIAYNASDERRYFKGVQDAPGKKGELFGLTNLFTFEEKGYMLRDIMHKTNVAETRAGVAAVDFKLDQNDVDSNDDDAESILSNKALGLDDDDEAKETSQMKRFAEFIASGAADGKGKMKKKFTKRSTANPINAILAKAGVQYTHDNSEVIGQSKIEAELSRKAMEVRNDLELGRKQVFQYSQSQSQPSLEMGQDEGVEYSPDEGDSGLDSGRKEFTINYRYRPDERVRRRQFCEMARLQGYDDPTEFALVVEEMTQEERRKMLEKFYRVRRRQIMQDIGSEQ